MKMKICFYFLFFLLAGNFAYSQNGRIDPCKVFGRIYIEKDRNFADFRVFIEENNAFAQLSVFKQSNKFFADSPGQWYFTSIRSEADFWVFFETEKGRSDFSISYINTESFAGCK